MLILTPATAGEHAVTAIENILDRQILLNPVHVWIIAGAIWASLLFIFVLFRWVLASRLSKMAERTETRFDDVAIKVLKDQRLWLYFFVTLFLASLWMQVPDPIKSTDSPDDIRSITRLLSAIKYVAVVAMAVQLFLSSRLIVDFGLEQLLDKTKSPDGKPDPTVRGSLVVLRFIIMLVVAVAVLLLALENFGVKVGPMITGLGIGGIALALAVQKVLGDVLASVSILMDKPFVVGDTVQVGDKTGTVEMIGIKTTRLRAPTGEQLIFGNADILSSRIHNFQRLEERRITFNLGVVFELEPAKLRRVPEIVKAVIDSKPQLRFDRCHLKAFADWEIQFETSYLVLTSDYRVHMDSQQAVLLDIFEAFNKEGIGFAYPTQVVREAPGTGQPK